MKPVFSILLCLLPGLLLGADLKIIINNARNDDGTMRVYLYAAKDKAQFLVSGFKDFACRQYGKIQAGSTEVTCKDVPPGSYALSFFHDENDNFNLDLNWAGLPSEGYGFSLNYKPKLRKPHFEEVEFKVEEADQIHQLKTLY